MKIIFVCTGNTCRSPMAEGICKKLLDDAGIKDIEVCSRGLFTNNGHPASFDACVAVMELYEVDIMNHRTQILSQEDVNSCDIIYCMTQTHKDTIERSMKLASMQDKKVLLLGGDKDIPDPYYCGYEDYKKCAQMIYTQVSQIVDNLGNNQDNYLLK